MNTVETARGPSMTVDEFIWKIIAAYQKEVCCEGFDDFGSEKRFLEAARTVVLEAFK